MIWTLSGDFILVEKMPISSTVPVVPPASIKSPILNGRKTSNITPAAEVAERPLKGQADRQTGRTQDRDDRCGLDAEQRQHRHDDKGEKEPVRHSRQERDQSASTLERLSALRTEPRMILAKNVPRIRTASAPTTLSPQLDTSPVTVFMIASVSMDLEFPPFSTCGERPATRSPSKDHVKRGLRLIAPRW